MEIQCVYGLDMGFSYSVLSIITTSLIASAIAYSMQHYQSLAVSEIPWKFPLSAAHLKASHAPALGVKQ